MKHLSSLLVLCPLFALAADDFVKGSPLRALSSSSSYSDVSEEEYALYDGKNSNQIFHEGQGKFCVLNDMGVFDVPAYLVDKEVRDMPKDQLKNAIATGALYLEAKPTVGNKTYVIHVKPRTLGGGPGGFLGGVAIGEIVGYGVIMVSGTICLYGTKKVIGVCAGEAAEETFGQQMVDRFLPQLAKVAERTGHIAGAVGGTVGAVSNPV